MKLYKFIICKLSTVCDTIISELHRANLVIYLYKIMLVTFSFFCFIAQ